MSADRCGVIERAFVEGGADFAYRSESTRSCPKRQADGNLDGAMRSRVAAVRRSARRIVLIFPKVDGRTFGTVK